jgi:hypothetical protein
VASGNDKREVPRLASRARDYVIVLNPTDQDIAIAQRLIMVHKGEDWPVGRLCRNDHERHPCRLYRWAVDVLVTAGWKPDRIAEVVQRRDDEEAATAIPTPCSLTG